MAEVLQQKKSAYPNLLYPVSRFRTGDQRWVAATFQYHGEAGLLRKLFVLDEMRDREAFLDQKKKTRRDRQKDEQATLPRSPKLVKPVEPDALRLQRQRLHRNRILKSPSLRFGTLMRIKVR